MTTLAGRKIRQFREGRQPKMGRPAFAERIGVKAGTVQGWEEEGKRPDKAEVVNRLAAEGIATHADWFVKAECSECALPSDDDAVAACGRADCPLAHRFAGVGQGEA
jgi:3-deoxy-7-phosphoheptulonate synthase